MCWVRLVKLEATSDPIVMPLAAKLPLETNCGVVRTPVELIVQPVLSVRVASDPLLRAMMLAGPIARFAPFSAPMAKAGWAVLAAGAVVLPTCRVVVRSQSPVRLTLDSLGVSRVDMVPATTDWIMQVASSDPLVTSFEVHCRLPNSTVLLALSRPRAITLATMPAAAG